MNTLRTSIIVIIVIILIAGCGDPAATPASVASVPGVQPTPQIVYITPAPTSAPVATPQPTPRPTPTPQAVAPHYLEFVTWTQGTMTSIATITGRTITVATAFSVGSDLSTLGNDGLAWLNDHQPDACYAQLHTDMFVMLSDLTLAGIDMMGGDYTNATSSITDATALIRTITAETAAVTAACGGSGAVNG